MTFDDYIKNPLGTNVMSNLGMYGMMYEKKLTKILVRENGKIDFKAFKVKKNYYLYIKIPSEVVPQFYYDVVIEFVDPGKLTDTTLRQYDIKVFSNDPSFVFTFCHAFIKHNMFIKELSSKMSNEALRKTGKVKNPEDQLGYVKSLYFAYLIMKKRGLFSKTRYNDQLTLDDIKKDIEEADDKINERQKKASNLNKKEKREVKPVPAPTNNDNSGLHKLDGINVTKKIMKTKPIQNIKNKTNTIKKVKKK